MPPATPKRGVAAVQERGWGPRVLTYAATLLLGAVCSPALSTYLGIDIPRPSNLINMVLERVQGTGLSGSFGIPNKIPRTSQVMDWHKLNVWDSVPPPTPSQIQELIVPPGHTRASLLEKPFHVYDPEFYSIIGSDPKLTKIGQSPKDPLFHEAFVWYPPTDEMFFCQNAGAPDAGTGMAKSSIIEKISLAQAREAAKDGKRENVGIVKIETVKSEKPVMNPNGAINYRGEFVFASEGQGKEVPSGVVRLNPSPPYNTTVLINNFHGRQFNSINDLAVHPKTGDLHFTDVTYGWLQDFRPDPGFPNQVYRYEEQTGRISVVADRLTKPNGVCFSPDGKHAYIADTGAAEAFKGSNPILPATIYRYDVDSAGLWNNKVTFAYVSPWVPDGVHCDSKGYVYAGCGDGVHVFSHAGRLIGKIYTGTKVANFQFAGNRMVMGAGTELWYAEIGAVGADVAHL